MRRGDVRVAERRGERKASTILPCSPPPALAPCPRPLLPAQSEAISAIRAHQSPIRAQSEPNQSPIRAQSEANQRPIRGHQKPSEAIRSGCPTCPCFPMVQPPCAGDGRQSRCRNRLIYVWLPRPTNGTGGLELSVHSPQRAFPSQRAPTSLLAFSSPPSTPSPLTRPNPCARSGAPPTGISCM